MNWEDDRVGFLVVGTAESWLPFYASVTTEKTNTVFQAFLMASGSLASLWLGLAAGCAAG